MKGKHMGKRLLFREDVGRRLKDPEFRKVYEEADTEVRLAVAVAEARERAGISQAPHRPADRDGSEKQLL